MKITPYAGGFIDALALVTVTVILFLAALLAGGCATATSTGHALIDCKIVDLDTGRSTPCR